MQEKKKKKKQLQNWSSGNKRRRKLRRRRAGRKGQDARTHQTNKEGETCGGGYLQERRLSQLQLVGTKILTLVGR
jgi:hypothetical protein